MDEEQVRLGWCRSSAFGDWCVNAFKPIYSGTVRPGGEPESESTPMGEDLPLSNSTLLIRRITKGHRNALRQGRSIMNVTLWILQVLLAAIFAAHGWLLVSPPPELIDIMNQELGVPFRLTLGVA